MNKVPFFLIHGAWHWGGCFQKTANLLGASGHAVVTPDLASHGYSKASWQSVDSMETYTASIAALLSKSAEPVILLGHSMGGASISYLAQMMPEKIKALVYLTAFMTAPGKSAHDYITPCAGDPVSASLFKLLSPVDSGAGLRLDLTRPSLLRDAFYANCSDRDFEVASHNVTETNSCIPVLFTPDAPISIPRYYISCTQDHAIPPTIQQQMINDLPGAVVYEIESDHSPFFSAAEELTEILRKIAAHANGVNV